MELDLAETRIRAGASAPTSTSPPWRYEAGIGGFHFYYGIPGAIGGALRMNAGANGVETRERVVEVHAVDRKGNTSIRSAMPTWATATAIRPRRRI